MRALVLLAAVTAGAVRAAPAPVTSPVTSPVTGTWLTEGGQALVRIEPCGAQLCGRIAKVLKPHPGGPAIDASNHDPALRNRPIEGLSILTGFALADGRWQGRVYDPESGRSYRSELTRHGTVLDVKGCLGPFCRTQHWTARP